jgi:nitroreductase
MAPQNEPARAAATQLSRAPGSDIPIGADSSVMDVMATMRAMRRLKPDPVPVDILTELVRAATWAPSGSDAQHYSFVVVTDRSQMAELGLLWREVVETYIMLMGSLVPGATDEAHVRMLDALRYQAEHFDDTPALIAACYRRSTPSAGQLLNVSATARLVKKLGATRLRHLAVSSRRANGLAEASSIYPAVQNLLLAARAHGLGATLTIWHLFNEPAFRRLLAVPSDYGIYALVPVGYPLGNFGPVRRRSVEEVIHWQRW